LERAVFTLDAFGRADQPLDHALEVGFARGVAGRNRAFLQPFIVTLDRCDRRADHLDDLPDLVGEPVGNPVEVAGAARGGYVLRVEPVQVALAQLALPLQSLVDLAPEVLVLTLCVDAPELEGLRIGRQLELDDLAQRNGRDRERVVMTSRFRAHDRETSLPAGCGTPTGLAPRWRLCSAFMNKVTNNKRSDGKL